MPSVPSPEAEKLLDEDDEEVLPAGAGVAPPIPARPVNPAKRLPQTPMRTGRPVFKPLQEKGEGLFRCGNCQGYKTPWRHDLGGAGPRKSCSEFGITPETRPCSFSIMKPLKKFNPISFGEVGISPNMTLADIFLTRILLNRREGELVLESSMPFGIGDKVQFIYQNKYSTGVVESFNRNYVYVQIKDAKSGNEKIVSLTVGSVTKLS